MAKVTEIPAKKQIGSLAQKKEVRKLRVAAYCRVSTDYEEQASSYQTQIEHYTDVIEKNPDWILAGIFADDGISATSTKNREQFNEMIQACKDGKIDMIITKSISRFARNTVDCLNYIRELKALNIPVFFEKESINTMDAKGEVLITIMASLAQQESESLSQNVKIGIKHRFQQGKVMVNANCFLGYDKDEDGHLVINPEQAEIVKRIFREYLEGASCQQIARGLERDGVLTARGNKRWHDSAIRRILENEKYMGDALLQKTYTVDFLNKKRSKNNGDIPQYYVEDDHEAIIPKELFMKAQEEMAWRGSQVDCKGRKRGFSSNHCFTGLICCAECGEQFRRIHWNNRGCKSVVWRCITRLDSSGDQMSLLVLVIAEEVSGVHQHFPLLETVLDSHFCILAERLRFLLCQRCHNGYQDFTLCVHRVDGLLFKENRNVDLLQQTDILQTVQGISGKAANRLRKYHIYFPLLAVFDHSIELISLFCICRADTLIRIHPDELPLRIRLDEFLIMLDLRLVAGCLFLIVR